MVALSLAPVLIRKISSPPPPESWALAEATSPMLSLRPAVFTSSPPLGDRSLTMMKSCPPPQVMPKETEVDEQNRVLFPPPPFTLTCWVMPLAKAVSKVLLLLIWKTPSPKSPLTPRSMIEMLALVEGVLTVSCPLLMLMDEPSPKLADADRSRRDSRDSNMAFSPKK